MNIIEKTLADGFTPNTWNQSVRKNKDGTRTMRIFGAGVNRLDPDTMKFEPISLAVAKGTQGFSVPKAAYGFKAPLFADGSFDFENNSLFDYRTKKIRQVAPLKSTRVFTDVAHVPGVDTGAGILYAGAFPSIGADLLVNLREEYIQHLIVFNAAPSGKKDVEIPFTISFGEQIEVESLKGDEKKAVSKTTKKDVDGRIVMKGANGREITIKEAYVWDSAGKRQKIKLKASSAGASMQYTKVIPREFLDNAVYPVFADDSTNINVTKDATFGVNNGVWAVCVAASSATSDNSNTLQYCYGNTGYTLTRSFLSCNASMGGGVVVSALNLHIYVVQNYGGGQGAKVYGPATPASDTSFVDDDFDQFGATPWSNNFDPGGGWESIALNASAIAAFAPNGYTRMALRHYTDYAASAPGSLSGFRHNSSEDSNIPYMEVTYTQEVTPAAPSSLAVAAVAGNSGALDLTWTDNSISETSFSIERSLNGSTGWTEVLTPAANATSAQDTGLTGDVTYYYRMRAYRSTDTTYSSYSSTANAATGPATPTGQAAAGVDGTTVIRVSWTDNSSSETSYEVERSDNGTTGWANVSGSLSAGVTSYDDDVGAVETTKYYRIRAVRSGLNGSYSSVAQGSSVPGTPVSAAAAAVTGGYNIAITWTDTASSETGYSIERSNDGSTGWAEVGTAAANAATFTDTTIGAGDTRRYYRVRAKRSGDGGDSAYSNTCNAYSSPQAPSNFATPISNLLVSSTWDDNSSTETGFKLERKYESDAYATINTPAANAEAYNDPTELAVGHTYTYRLSAYRSSDGVYSPTTTSVVVVPPEEPSNLLGACTVAAATTSKIQLTWDINSTEETGFLVERSPNGSTGWTTVTTTDPGIGEYLDTGLTIDTTYYYRVTAVGAAANSAPTSVVAVLTSLGNAAVLLLAFRKKTNRFPLQ